MESHFDIIRNCLQIYGRKMKQSSINIICSYNIHEKVWEHFSTGFEVGTLFFYLLASPLYYNWSEREKLLLNPVSRLSNFCQKIYILLIDVTVCYSLRSGGKEGKWSVALTLPKTAKYTPFRKTTLQA